MGNRVIGSNLRRLRVSKGMTQQHLAAASGLSRVGYRNIETGRSLPRVETLRALATALEVPVRDLVAAARELRQVRFRSLRRLRSREQILAQVGQKIADVTQLEEALGDVVPFAFAGRSADVRSGSEQRAIAMAAAVREAFGRREDEPIRDICGLLESKGVKVFSLQLASSDFFGLSVGPDDGGPAVVVNTWERISVERWIFTAAHELGHLVLHLDAYDVEEASEDRHQERDANLFASHFLMPEGVFGKEWAETDGLPFVKRVLKVKRMFRVSYRTILYRLAQRQPGVNVWRLFQNEYRQWSGSGLGGSEEPDAARPSDDLAGVPEPRSAAEPTRLAPEDFIHDRMWHLVRRGVEGGHISLSKAADILGLSLEQMRATTRGWAEVQ
jgi:Zn-dependent peptidase ImmA (M78 family)/transcriptional regulator with XRE-family HTH domain